MGWPEVGGADLVRRVRTAETQGKAYLLAVLDGRHNGREIADCIAAGAHDFLRRPLVTEEVVSRVRAPRRLRQWALVNLASAHEDVPPFDLKRLRTWSAIGTIFAEDLGQMLGEPLEATDGWPEDFGKGTLGAIIPMSLAKERVELRVSVGVDLPTLRQLGATLLGDPAASRDALDDMLREIANAAGGAIKRAALPEDVVMTTGIPVSAPIPRPSGDSRCWTVPMRGGGRVAIVGEIVNHENVRVPASRLREGMVLVEDLRNGVGALLVPAGTRLTATTVERVAALLGHKYLVEVASAA
jgi:hypothetical protein